MNLTIIGRHRHNLSDLTYAADRASVTVPGEALKVPLQLACQHCEFAARAARNPPGARLQAAGAGSAVSFDGVTCAARGATEPTSTAAMMHQPRTLGVVTHPDAATELS